jgi:hypothetical protein
MVYEIYRVPGITFIRYAHDQKVGKTNNLNVFGSNKTKNKTKQKQNKIAKLVIANLLCIV